MIPAQRAGHSHARGEAPTRVVGTLAALAGDRHAVHVLMNALEGIFAVSLTAEPRP